MTSLDGYKPDHCRLAVAFWPCRLYDNMFLEAAVAGKADFIVSRDNDLLRLKEFRGITINSPEVMAQWVRKNIK